MAWSQHAAGGIRVDHRACALGKRLFAGEAALVDGR